MAVVNLKPKLLKGIPSRDLVEMEQRISVTRPPIKTGILHKLVATGITLDYFGRPWSFRKLYQDGLSGL